MSEYDTHSKRISHAFFGTVLALYLEPFLKEKSHTELKRDSPEEQTKEP